MSQVIYCFVRRDLSGPQRVVQAGHALIETQRNFPYEGEHPYLIMIGVKTEKKLLEALDFLQNHGILGAAFKEPDRDNELTAIATKPLVKTEETKKLFRKYQLLKE